MRRITSTLTILALALGPASAADYLIKGGDEANLVKFVSEAPLETVEGRTREVSGIVRTDLADLAAGAEVEVSVDLASLDTGNGLRNGHMRDNHLETEQYPNATFKGAELKKAPAAIAPGEKAAFEITGDFSLHGVTRRITVPVELSHEADGSLTVKARFEVKLADYEINRPKFLFMKLDEVQKISLVLAARPAPEVPAAE